MSTMRRNPTTGEYEFVPDGRNLFGGLGGINPERPQGNEPAITDKKLGDRYLPPEPNSMGGPTSEGRFVGPDHPLYDTLPSGGGNTMIPLQGVDAERLKRQRGYYERGPDALGSNIYTGDTGDRRLGYVKPVDDPEVVYRPPADDPRDPRTKGMYPTYPDAEDKPVVRDITPIDFNRPQPTFTMPTLEDAKRKGVTTDPSGGFDPRSLLTNSNVFPADGYTTVGLGRDRANVQRINPFSIYNQQQAQQNARQDNLRGLASPFATSFRRPQQNVQHQLMYGGPQQSQRARQQNPFEGNEQYQALMDYQKTMRPNEDQRAQMQSLMDAMQPNQEQRDRMGELRTAFEGTGGYKDYRIQQMEQQLQQRQRQNPRMGMGLGSQRPQGMGMFGGFPQVQQRPQGRDMFNGFPMQTAPRPQGIMGGYGQQPYQQQYGGFQGGYGGMGGYGRPQQNPYGEASQIARSMPQAPQFSGGYAQQQMPQPTYQPYQNPYQQQSPQPQQYGGYGMGQSQGGFGGYGGISNPYQPQQYGNQNNSMGYQQPRY